MAESTADQLTFPSFDRRRIEAGFGGADISSAGGILLLRQIDRRLGLTQAISEAIPDPRAPERIEHSQLQQLRQRVYGIAHGYEDLNDHDTLRHDPTWHEVKRVTVWSAKHDPPWTGRKSKVLAPRRSFHPVPHDYRKPIP